MQADHTQLWERCLEIIRDNISAQQFSAWFSPIKSYSFSNGELRLIVPTSFYVEHIEELYLNLLMTTIKKVYGEGVKLFYCYTTVQNESTSGVEVRSAEYSP